ncbi:MAG: patatin-like phospholipase family protein [Myxococcota bacterium]|nr:patatin-like phospholipase family protein [Myxococcota bacterium]
MVNDSFHAQLGERRVGIVLSSAFFGFYAHLGFLRALLETGIKPSVYGGSSAGALVAAMGATDQVMSLWPVLGQLRRQDIWDPGYPKGRPVGLLRGRKLKRILDTHLPAKHFEECETPLVTVCTNVHTGRVSYDRTGPLVDAIRASCAVPFMFTPIIRDGQSLIDGGLLDKAPIAATVETHPIDVLIIHLIESPTLRGPMPNSPLGLLNRLLDLSRKMHWKQQAAWAQERGIEVYVFSSTTQAVGPFSMNRGLSIMTNTYTRTLRCLTDSNRPWKWKQFNEAVL